MAATCTAPANRVCTVESTTSRMARKPLERSFGVAPRCGALSAKRPYQNIYLIRKHSTTSPNKNRHKLMREKKQEPPMISWTLDLFIQRIHKTSVSVIDAGWQTFLSCTLLLQYILQRNATTCYLWSVVPIFSVCFALNCQNLNTVANPRLLQRWMMLDMLSLAGVRTHS